jgi:DNA-binding transcriptional ArsR family regulator
MKRDVFHAIADPTRREIIGMLSKQELNLNKIADHFSITRPAVSQQVKILVECGLVTVRVSGRERYCRAQLQKLHQVSRWLEHYKHFWNKKLDELEVFLKANPGKGKKIKSKKNGKIKRSQR